MPIPGFQPLEPLDDFAHGHLVVADLAMLLAAFILREHARRHRPRMGKRHAKLFELRPGDVTVLLPGEKQAILRDLVADAPQIVFLDLLVEDGRDLRVGDVLPLGECPVGQDAPPPWRTRPGHSPTSCPGAGRRCEPATAIPAGRCSS